MEAFPWHLLENCLGYLWKLLQESLGSDARFLFLKSFSKLAVEAFPGFSYELYQASTGSSTNLFLEAFPGSYTGKNQALYEDFYQLLMEAFSGFSWKTFLMKVSSYVIFFQDSPGNFSHVRFFRRKLFKASLRTFSNKLLNEEAPVRFSMFVMEASPVVRDFPGFLWKLFQTPIGYLLRLLVEGFVGIIWKLS